MTGNYNKLRFHRALYTHFYVLFKVDQRPPGLAGENTFAKGAAALLIATRIFGCTPTRIAARCNAHWIVLG